MQKHVHTNPSNNANSNCIQTHYQGSGSLKEGCWVLIHKEKSVRKVAIGFLSGSKNCPVSCHMFLSSGVQIHYKVLGLIEQVFPLCCKDFGVNVRRKSESIGKRQGRHDLHSPNPRAQPDILFLPISSTTSSRQPKSGTIQLRWHQLGQFSFRLVGQLASWSIFARTNKLWYLTYLSVPERLFLLQQTELELFKHTQPPHHSPPQLKHNLRNSKTLRH